MNRLAELWIAGVLLLALIAAHPADAGQVAVPDSPAIATPNSTASRSVNPGLREQFLERTNPDAMRVLRFWFEEWDEDIERRGKGTFNPKWFPRGTLGIEGMKAVDRVIRERFTRLFDAAVAEALDWRIETNPYENLAYIILIDQFSRHIYRGSARAFEHDALALAAAELNIERRFYAYYFTGYQKLFVVAPLIHHEELGTQERSLRYLKALNEHADHRYEFLGVLKKAVAHYQVILMFGRFPHRNERLGRPHSALEAAYLGKQGAPGFIDGSKW